MKKKVLVCGCNGHMGRIVCELISQTIDMEVTCGFDVIKNLSGPFPIYNDITSIMGKDNSVDVIIDFSSPTATDDILKYAWINKTPIVIATTGLSDVTLAEIHKVSEEIPIFQSANMSIQVNLVKQILKMVAGTIPTAEVEITETHHNRKKDAPSGTAKLFATTVKDSLESTTNASYDIVYGRDEKRKENEIGICSKRGANIVGTHTIEFFSPFETLEITHTAHSRELFADGAIKASRFLLGKEPGLYGMDDLA